MLIVSSIWIKNLDINFANNYKNENLKSIFRLSFNGKIEDISNLDMLKNKERFTFFE